MDMAEFLRSREQRVNENTNVHSNQEDFRDVSNSNNIAEVDHITRGMFIDAVNNTNDNETTVIEKGIDSIKISKYSTMEDSKGTILEDIKLDNNDIEILNNIGLDVETYLDNKLFSDWVNMPTNSVSDLSNIKGITYRMMAWVEYVNNIKEEEFVNKAKNMLSNIGMDSSDIGLKTKTIYKDDKVKLYSFKN